MPNRRECRGGIGGGEMNCKNKLCRDSLKVKQLMYDLSQRIKMATNEFEYFRELAYQALEIHNNRRNRRKRNRKAAR